MKWRITLTKDEDGWITATCPSLPGCVSQGKSEKQAIKNMKEAIQVHVRSLAEDGIPLKDSQLIISAACGDARGLTPEACFYPLTPEPRSLLSPLTPDA